MVYIFHGEYQEASRTALLRNLETHKNKEVRRFDWRSITDEQLVSAVESSSMFGGDVVVVLEGVFSGLGRKQSRISMYAEIINRSAKEGTDIIIWEPKLLTSAILKLFPDASVSVFKMPALIFSLLDAVSPGNAQRTLSLFRKLTKAEPSEIVFVMLLRRVRQLIEVKDHGQPKGLAPWQVSRLTRQAGSFTMDQLLTMHDRLYHMDSSIKTGTTPFSLAQHIEQLLINT